MKINWFRIENFRSIIDSGVCYLDSGITLLAGKNESGKSNILRALECFGVNDFNGNCPQDIQDDVYPEVTISFTFSRDELNDSFSFPEDDSNDYELIISRTGKYLPSYSGKCFQILAKESIENEISEKGEIYELVKKLATITKKPFKIRISKLYYLKYKVRLKHPCINGTRKKLKA
ncbi:MAG: AAA family ATPase [Geobacteraceae bacterium]|nr:AAA family ATPase [Geobacteraceae bacterium]